MDANTLKFFEISLRTTQKQICVNVSVNSLLLNVNGNMSHKTSISYIYGSISNILVKFCLIYQLLWGIEFLTILIDLSIYLYMCSEIFISEYCSYIFSKILDIFRVLGLENWAEFTELCWTFFFSFLAHRFPYY